MKVSIIGAGGMGSTLARRLAKLRHDVLIASSRGAVDAGNLDDSWRQATGTPAYCRDLDAQALRQALAAVDRSRVAEYREQEEARIRRAHT